MRTVLLGIIDGETLLDVLEGRGRLPEPDDVGPRRVVRLQTQRWIVEPLGNPEELFGELMGRRHLAACRVAQPQSPLRVEALAVLAEPGAEVLGAPVSI
jgi:hypothetical protein